MSAGLGFPIGKISAFAFRWRSAKQFAIVFYGVCLWYVWHGWEKCMFAEFYNVINRAVPYITIDPSPTAEAASIET